MNAPLHPPAGSSQPEIIVCTDVNSLYERAAAIFVEEAAGAIAARGRFMVALSGGSTPHGVYRLLASADWRDRLKWEKVHVFWGDERFVPPTSPESNYGMAWSTLLSEVAIPPVGIHAVPTDLPTVEEAAIAYEKTIREVFCLPAQEIPQLDLVLLGLGADGHTASLFPHSGTLRHEARWVVAGYLEAAKAFRITMTPLLLNRARAVLFLVAGNEKAGAVREVLLGEHHPDRLPAQLISPLRGSLRWLLDRAAAGRLPREASGSK
ncbi:MAG: 6-phosphogluconolactonase [Acidobacteria bacterium RIFCSPLOWO2_12_FULL_60_22]|nr:MAG: 6-phosphogluconolactonase [Acidobacteria bacterium RIFCSPLOWO2_12_FULL_60_22]